MYVIHINILSKFMTVDNSISLNNDDKDDVLDSFAVISNSKEADQNGKVSSPEYVNDDDDDEEDDDDDDDEHDDDDDDDDDDDER